jgi:hypothetical protein
MCRITVFVAEPCESLSLEESEGVGIVSTSERRQEGGELEKERQEGQKPKERGRWENGRRDEDEVVPYTRQKHINAPK